jgi:intracellular septation protein
MAAPGVGYHRSMQLLLEFLPVAAFLVAYFFFGGIYVATTVLMIAMPLALLVLWIRTRRLPPMFFASTLLVLAFGAATLWLRDARFIQWKPSIFMWAIALAFLASSFIGRKTLAEHLMHQMVEPSRMQRSDWLKLNAAWVGYAVVAGAANILVARLASEALWVKFKLLGLMGLMVVFMAGLVWWLHSKGKLRTEEEQSPASR